MLSTLFGLLNGEYQFSEVILNLGVIVFAWCCCLPVHESAHAWVADKLGDPTGRLSGRISLNPMTHFSLMGTLLFLVFGFGYAKAVPVNMRNFKNVKRDVAITSLAGPASNLLLAFVFAFLTSAARFVIIKAGLYENIIANVTYNFCFGVSYVNVALAVFNLIPVPPLDGSRLLTAFLPSKLYYKLFSYERYILYGFFALIFIFNRLGFSPLDIVSGFICDLIFKLVDLPFDLLLH